MREPSKLTRSRRASVQTRQAILDAARYLFTQRGYFQTKVGDIAAEARVSVAWVHAVGGGKSGLLRTLIEDGVTTNGSAQALEPLTTISDPAELVRILVHSTRVIFESWSGLMRPPACPVRLHANS